MKLLDALLTSIADVELAAVKYRDRIWYHDPYDVEAKRKGSIPTEFISAIGSFGEMSLANCFAPPLEDYFGDYHKDPTDPEERRAYMKAQVRLMYRCEDFEAITKEDL